MKLAFRRVARNVFVTGFFLGASLRAENPNDLPQGLEVKSYTGWNESVFLRATKSPVQLVMVPAVGGRIVHYSLNGENIIFENAAAQGKTLSNTKGEFWVGGYQCDVGPELADLPSHQKLWVGPHRWRTDKDFSAKVYSASDSRLGVQLEKEMVIDPTTGDLGLTQRLRNTSEKEVSYCLWDRTLCKGGGFAFFPLNKKSRFKAGWSQRRTVDGKYSYDGENPDSTQVQILDGVLVAETKGEATKVGADSDAGWIAYAKGKLLFIKFFPYFPKGHYTDGGNSVELYFDQRVAELEPISPETKLEPEQNFTFAEKWVLIPLEKEVTTFEEARKLVKKIPTSPFAPAGN